MGTKTIGEISKSYGYDNPSDFFNELEKRRKEFKMFCKGDIVKLPSDYEPTHFKNEKCLPTNYPLSVSEVDEVNIFCDYHIKIEGYPDIWFDAKIFVKSHDLKRWPDPENV